MARSNFSASSVRIKVVRLAVVDPMHYPYGQRRSRRSRICCNEYGCQSLAIAEHPSEFGGRKLVGGTGAGGDHI